MYVFNIYILLILGDLSCMESFTDYPHGLPFFFFCLYPIKL